MTLALAMCVVAGIVLPHAVHLQRVPPLTAVAVWLGALALRALTCALAVVYLVLFFPAAGPFEALTHWCAHAVLPVLTMHVEGHSIGVVAVVVPGLVLAVSLVSVAVGVARAARALRLLSRRDVLGRGPRGSVVVGGPDIVFAVAGLVHPRIVVSAGALTTLDDDELAAGLDHEQAHIARRHRFVMLLALTLRSVGRFVPGADRAVREVAFHLERDADICALGHCADRLALARVISKAAAVKLPTDGIAMTGLGEAGVQERISQLLETTPRPHGRLAAMVSNGLAVIMAAAVLALAAAVPAAAIEGARQDPHHGHHAHHCTH
jgi:Zn-dependent protease with chaperone function